MLHSFHRTLSFPLATSTARQLGVLSLMTTYCISLVAVRYGWTGQGAFGFLIWNLFLAWMPVLFSTTAEFFYQQTRSSLLVLLVAVPWLLFLPNAPYIVTDLVHLRPRPAVPYWFDILLFTSFAFHGLLLGFHSLYQFHRILTHRLRPSYGWILMSMATIGAAYGIYLGRVLRWNSWDILRHPLRIAVDSLRPLLHPFTHKEAVGMTVVLSGFLFLGYLVYRARLRD